MNLRIARFVLSLAIALSAMGADAAWADRFPRSGPRDGGLPASVRRVQRETGGEVLKAQPFQRDGREMYRVKVLTPQGRIRVVEDEGQRDDQPPAYPRGGPASQNPRGEPAANYPRQGPASPADPYFHQGAAGPYPYPHQMPPPNYPRQAPLSYPRQMPPGYSPPPRNHFPE